MLTAVYIYIFYVLICVNAQTFISYDMSIRMFKPSQRRKLTPDYDEGSLEANGLHSDPKKRYQKKKGTKETSCTAMTQY